MTALASDSRRTAPRADGYAMVAAAEGVIWAMLLVVLPSASEFGLGFQLTNPGIRPLGPNPRSFGHYGNGAVLGFADPDTRLGFGFVCNRAGKSWRDPRNIALIDAVYESL